MTIGDFLQTMPSRANRAELPAQHGWHQLPVLTARPRITPQPRVQRTLVLVTGAGVVPSGLGADSACDLTPFPPKPSNRVDQHSVRWTPRLRRLIRSRRQHRS